MLIEEAVAAAGDHARYLDCSRELLKPFAPPPGSKEPLVGPPLREDQLASGDWVDREIFGDYLHLTPEGCVVCECAAVCDFSLWDFSGMFLVVTPPCLCLRVVTRPSLQVQAVGGLHAAGAVGLEERGPPATKHGGVRSRQNSARRARHTSRLGQRLPIVACPLCLLWLCHGAPRRGGALTTSSLCFFFARRHPSAG